MTRAAKPAGKKMKLAIFILLIGVAALTSILLKLMFPDPSAIAITLESGGSTPAVASATASESPAGRGEAPESAAKPTVDLIPIYLVGAVRKPGVYQVERGSYLFELVEQAGGLTEDAASEAINLAFCLETNQRIWLPSRREAEDPASGGTGRIGSVEWPGEMSSMLIDINQADEALLDTLPGIGPATASDIVAFRAAHGAFKKTEDLMNVSGIKESRFERLKDLICVTGRP